MPIYSRPFGGVMLTGKAAEAFKKQFIDNPIKENKAAKESLKRGMEIIKKGGRITLKKREEDAG